MAPNEDADMLVFINRQLAEQLVRKRKRLPPVLRNWIVKKIIPGHRSSLNEEETTKQDEAMNQDEAPHATASPISKVAKKMRRHYIRGAKKSSNWWRQFLT
jgi:hypothetical protein